MPHLVLLGDSIFDNGQYTSGGPDVISQVRRLLPAGWEGSLLALDGSTTSDIAAQVERLPTGATHGVLSVGGNDAIMHSSGLGLGLFGFQAEPQGHLLQTLADTLDRFEADYRRAVSVCLRAKLPLGVCTIYNCRFPEKDYQRALSTGLAIFNDVILRVAIENNLPVLDLRQVCVTQEDYANPIEPSSIGGEKIARAIVAMVTASHSSGHAARIFVGAR